MTIRAGRPNGGKAAVPARGRMALFASLLISVTSLAPDLPARAAEGLIYVNGSQANSLASLSASFRQSLSSAYDLDVAQAASDADVMRLIAADPRNIGFVQRDLYLDFVQANAASGVRFEFYGDIPACIAVAVRKGSPLRSYPDLVRSRSGRPITLDVGPGNGRVAETFGLLARVDPALSGVALEHRGGARALSRVMSGDTDAAFTLIYAPFTNSMVNSLVTADSIDLVPFFSEKIVAAAVDRGLPYMLRQIRLGDTGWFATGFPYHTTCTSLGVVVNARTDARLSEAVARTLLRGDMGGGARSWLERIGALLTEAVAGAHQIARDVGQVVTAWLGNAGGTALAGDQSEPAPVRPAVEDGASPEGALQPAFQRGPDAP